MAFNRLHSVGKSVGKSAGKSSGKGVRMSPAKQAIKGLRLLLPFMLWLGGLACAASHQPTQPADLGRARGSQEMLALLKRRLRQVGQSLAISFRKADVFMVLMEQSNDCHEMLQ